MFPAATFEEFYPSRYDDAVNNIKNAPKSAKRDLKRSLLLEVLSWASDHPNEVEQEFRDSARPVIDRLEAILTAIS
jgi:hypothetical protein